MTRKEREKVRELLKRSELKEYFAKTGKQGGKARAKNMTPEQRKEGARKAAQARWKKTKPAAEK